MIVKKCYFCLSNSLEFLETNSIFSLKCKVCESYYNEDVTYTFVTNRLSLINLTRSLNGGLFTISIYTIDNVMYIEKYKNLSYKMEDILILMKCFDITTDINNNLINNAISKMELLNLIS